MSYSAAQANKFIVEILEMSAVWAIRDNVGFPTSTNLSGESSMPFWSSKSRAQSIIDKVDAYQSFEPHQLTLVEFTERWLPGLERDGFLVGLNWSGDSATGYDLSPLEVLSRIKSANC